MIRPSKLLAARNYILTHPDETKNQQSAGSGVSVGMIGLARQQLIAEGKLASNDRTPIRGTVSKQTQVDTRPLIVAAAPAQPAPPAGLLDHQAMQALADIAILEDLDDDEVQKRMLKQCIRFAFDPKLHADTRMSASVQWGKLRDAVKAKDLGPGPPLTRTAARERLTDLQKSIDDVTLAVEALFAAYPPAVLFPAITAALEGATP